MALLFADGCDVYAADSDLVDRWTVTSTGAAGWQALPTGGVNGVGAMICNVDDNYAKRRFRDSGSTTNYVRFSAFFKSGGAPGAADFLMSFYDSTTSSHAAVYIENTGEIGCRRSDTISGGGTVGSSTGANLHDGTWHFFEAEYLCSNTVGVWKFWIDGSLQVNFSGDTLQASTCNPNEVWLAAPDTTGTWDDIIIWDDTTAAGDNFPTGDNGGVQRVIETLFPNGDDTTAWTPDTGVTNYTQVDEVAHDGDTTYVESSGANDVDLYDYTALTLVPTSIDGVVVSTQQKSEAGGGTFRHKAKSSATTADGATKTETSLTTTLRQTCFGQDPNTAAAWATAAAVNAAKFGIERLT